MIIRNEGKNKIILHKEIKKRNEQAKKILPCSFEEIGVLCLLQVIIGCFFGNLYVMGMAFAQ